MTKSLLITGSSGFIGKNLLIRSRALNKFKITALYNSNLPSIKTNKEITFKKVNLLNKEELQNLFDDFDVIIHMAGVMMTSATSKNNPFKGITDNLQIITNILEEIKENPPDKFIWMSSTTGYPESKKNLNEEDFFFGEVAKRYEIVGSLYRLMEKLVNKILLNKCNLITLRPTGVFGEEDDFSPDSSHVLPKIIREAYLNLLPETIYAEKEEMRNWIYIGDLVKAIDSIIDNSSRSMVLNIGSKESISMYKLHQIILENFSLEKKHFIDPNPSSFGLPMARKINCELSQKYLGEYNSTRLEDGIDKTINWYKNFLKNKKF